MVDDSGESKEPLRITGRGQLVAILEIGIANETPLKSVSSQLNEKISEMKSRYRELRKWAWDEAQLWELCQIEWVDGFLECHRFYTQRQSHYIIPLGHEDSGDRVRRASELGKDMPRMTQVERKPHKPYRKPGKGMKRKPRASYASKGENT
jgi:hypothetical protein